MSSSTFSGSRYFMIHLRSFMVIILLICLKGAIGQQFNALTIKNGLSSNAVISIAQDSTGFIWLGTINGLNRFDGYQFKFYDTISTQPNSLNGDYILSLLADRDGLWVGTNEGLNRYNPGRDNFTPITNRAGDRLQINALWEDQTGKLWIGSSVGLFSFRTERFKTKANTHNYMVAEKMGDKDSVKINCLLEDHHGILWIGTPNGLFQANIHSHQQQFTRYQPTWENSIDFSKKYISCITEDLSGNLWIGTPDEGIYQILNSTKAIRHYEQSGKQGTKIISNNVRKILLDNKGLLWIGCQSGITKLDPISQKAINFQHHPGDWQSLSQNSVYALLQDRQNSIWVGTYFGGVNIVDPAPNSFHKIQSSDQRNSLNSNVISSIVAEKNNHLWIGTQVNGLNLLNLSTGKFKAFKNNPKDPNSISSNMVDALYLNSHGALMIGTHGGGVNILPPGQTKFKKLLFNPNNTARFNWGVIAFLQDSMQRFWLAGSDGIKILHPTSSGLKLLPETPLTKTAAQIIATSFLQDQSKQIWIGAYQGLFVCKNNQIQRTSIKTQVNCLYLNTDGNLWIGTQHKGLVFYNTHTDKSIFYNKSNGLLTNNIIGILKDNHQNLWLSTDNGLVKFNTQNKVSQTFTTTDGLTDNQFNRNSFFKDSLGQMYFGGFNGITSFNPDSIQTNQSIVPLIFTGIKLFGKPFNPTLQDSNATQNISFARSIKLAYNQNVFSIEFALLNYIKSNKNKYAYKLTGYDKSWITTSQPVAGYTNVLPGSYTLYVKAANNDGIWSQPIQMEITITPPIWKTWWAYLLYIAITLVILFFIIQYFFLKEILKKEEALHENKLNFFTNISHEIRTHLSLIMIPLDNTLRDLGHEHPTTVKLNQVHSNTQKLMQLVTELMDFQKAETSHLKLKIAESDLIVFLKEIYDSFQDMAISKKISTEFNHDQDNMLIQMDKIQMEKVFFNLVSNALKFAPIGGRMAISIKSQVDTVRVIIENNGQGISPLYKDKIFNNYYQIEEYGTRNTGYGIGLALAKSITELHGGKISVSSKYSKQNDGYTIFSIILPKMNTYKHPSINDLPIQSSTLTPITETTTPFLNSDNFYPSDIRFLKKQKILLIEDNEALRSNIKQMLLPYFQVLEAPDGQIGWEMATEIMADLIISDIMMPHMDGISLTNKLKNDQRTSHIPVVLLTAKSAQSDIEGGLETGADVYVTKPFSSKALLLNVRNLIISKERSRIRFSMEIMESTAQADGEKYQKTQITHENEFLNTMISLIEENMDAADLTVDMLARKLAMSKPVLYKKVRALTGMTVNDIIKSLRLKRACILLKQQNLTVNEICFAIGYTDRRYFSKEFKKKFGKTPSEYAKDTQVN